MVELIYAESGHWSDIQDAGDQANIGDNIRLPEGVLNFLDLGEVMSPAQVIIPAGVNLLGTPTSRTSGLPIPKYGMNPNDQVVEWKTKLVIPSHDCAPTPPGAPTDIPIWIRVNGSGAPDRKTRVSDIMFVGYREYDPSSTQQTRPIEMNGAINFRVDHCNFLNLAGGAVVAHGANVDPNHLISGVIDHNRIENPAGGKIAPWEDRTITYGVLASRHPQSKWDPEIANILGNYTDYSIFIEDNYISKWRHGIAANHGAHYISRYNTFNDTYGYGEVDCHIGNKTTEVGTRAIEVYNNKFTNCVQPTTFIGVIFFRGGGGAIFNNYVDTTFNIQEGNGFDGRFISMSCILDRFPYTYVHDLWIWNNEETVPLHVQRESGPAYYYPLENEDYFLHEPHTFEYKPYPYPVSGLPLKKLSITSNLTGFQFKMNKAG